MFVFQVSMETYNVVSHYTYIYYMPLESRDQNDNTDSKDGLSAVIIGGVIAGAVLFIIIIILLCIGIWCVKHSKQKRSSFAPDESVLSNPG